MRVTGGQPARGLELGSLKVSNSIYSGALLRPVALLLQPVGQSPNPISLKELITGKARRREPLRLPPRVE
jgi:hypothetical protein